MKSFIKKLIFVLLLLGTLAVGFYDAKVTYENYQTKNEIYEKSPKHREEIVKEWRENTMSRLVGIAAVCVFYGVVLAAVIYVGPAQEKKKRISKDEALVFMDDFENDYKEMGQLVTADDRGELDEEEVVPDYLDTPELVSATYANRAVTVTWKRVDGAKTYSIWRRHDKEPFIRVGKANGSDSKYMDYALDADTTYYYSVKAFVTTDLEKVESEMDPMGLEVHVKNGNRLPAPELKVVQSEGKNKLVWEPVEGAVSYRIFRSEDGFKWRHITRVKSTQPLEYEVEEGNEGKYYYAVATACLVNKVPVIGEYDKKGVQL